MLLEAGLASEQDILAVMVRAREESLDLRRILTDVLHVDELRFARRVAAKAKLATEDLDRARPDQSALELVPPSLARQCMALPLAADEDSVTVVMAFPFDAEAVADLEYVTGRRIRIRVAPASAVIRGIDEHYDPDRLGAPALSLREAASLAEGARRGFAVVLLGGERSALPATIGANIAYWLAQEGKDVLLADLVTAAADVGALVGFEPERALEDHVADPFGLSKAITKAGCGFSFLGGVARGFTPDRLPPARRRGLYRQLALIGEKYDISVVVLWPVASAPEARYALACDLAAAVVTSREPEQGYLALKGVVEMHTLLAGRPHAGAIGASTELPRIGIVAADIRDEPEGKDIFSRAVEALSAAFGSYGEGSVAGVDYLGPVFADEARMRLARHERVLYSALFPARLTARALAGLARRVRLASETGRKRESVKNRLRKFADITDEEM